LSMRSMFPRHLYLNVSVSVNHQKTRIVYDNVVVLLKYRLQREMSTDEEAIHIANWIGLIFQGLNMNLPLYIVKVHKKYCLWENTKRDKHVYTKSNTLTLTLIPRKHWIYLVVSQENIAVVWHSHTYILDLWNYTLLAFSDKINRIHQCATENCFSRFAHDSCVLMDKFHNMAMLFHCSTFLFEKYLAKSPGDNSSVDIIRSNQ
jgi:hypothetical protein